MDRRIENFDEFWPFYVCEHKNKLTRQFHFVGTSLALSALVGGAFTRHKWLLAAAPVLGYGPAWFSHFVIEKNRPATFKYPLWSLMADFVMWGKMLAGTMDGEVEQILSLVQSDEPEPEPDSEIRPNMATDGTLN
ncbi:MAG: DUF962 domain-containing protein [Polyangiaceae bacterium]